MSSPPPVPILRYSFDSWTTGQTTVTNEGSLGTYNATLRTDGTGGSATVVGTSATGTQCLSLVGNSYSGGYLQLPSFTMGGDNWAICWWVKIVSLPVGLFSFNDFRADVTFPSSCVVYTNNNTNETLSGTVSVSDNKWHHIALVYNTNTLLIYIDGVVNVSSFLSTVVSTFRTTNTFGKYGMMSIDDIRIYDNVALCSTDVIDLNFLLVRYSFENGVQNSGILGSSCDGALYSSGVGSATIISTDSATETKCLRLYSVDISVQGGYMTIPSVTLGGKSWSICYWYKCDTTQINGGYVFGFMQDNGMNYFSNYFNNNALCFSINNGMNSKIYYFTSNSCCDNKWRHVTLVYNFTLSKYFMYFNGVLCTNSISATGDFFNVAATYSMNDLGGIGGNSAVFFSSTLIDDFRVYSNVALGISDIAYISGNNKFYTRTSTPVLLNTLFDANQLSSYSKSTGFVTRIGREFYDLSTVYAPYSTGSFVYTNFMTNLFVRWQLSSCINYMSADYGISVVNGTVAQWTDQSSYHSNFTQTNSLYQPTTTNSTIFLMGIIARSVIRYH